MRISRPVRIFIQGGGIYALLLAAFAAALLWAWPSFITGLIFAITLYFVAMAAKGPGDGPA